MYSIRKALVGGHFMILIKKADDATAAGISWNDHLSESLMLFAALYQYIGGGGYDLPCHRKIIYENRFYSSMIDSSYEIKYLKRYYWESEDSVRKSGVRPFDVSHTFLRLCRESLSVHKLLYFEIFLWLESTKEKQFSCFIFRWHRISTAPPPNYHPTYTSPEHTNSLWFDPIR